MKIRRYYGHDCDSVMGFNNGYYVDDTYIDVKDHDEAFERCKEFLTTQFQGPFSDTDVEEWDDGYQLITGYYDDEGNDMTSAAWLEANENTEVGSYRYVYVTYEVVVDESEGSET